MGEVYLASHAAAPGRLVALKRLSREYLDRPAFRARFEREARVLKERIGRSDYIVRVYEAGEDAEGPWLAMEYVAGPADLAKVDPPPGWGPPPGGTPPAGLRWPNPPASLQQWVVRGGKYAPEAARVLAEQLATAVEYAHAAGVIHRDIKPANILIDADGIPKLVDFGLARELGAGVQELTQAVDNLGTAAYLPPEMIRSAVDVDARADVFMLAGTLLFALTGHLPQFVRDEMIDPSLRSVLRKAHHPDRNQRFASAKAFREALRSPGPVELPGGAHVEGSRCPKCQAPYLPPAGNVKQLFCHSCSRA